MIGMRLISLLNSPVIFMHFDWFRLQCSCDIMLNTPCDISYYVFLVIKISSAHNISF